MCGHDVCTSDHTLSLIWQIGAVEGVNLKPWPILRRKPSHATMLLQAHSLLGRQAALGNAAWVSALLTLRYTGVLVRRPAVCVPRSTRVAVPPPPNRRQHANWATTHSGQHPAATAASMHGVLVGCGSLTCQCALVATTLVVHGRSRATGQQAPSLTVTRACWPCTAQAAAAAVARALAAAAGRARVCGPHALQQ